MNDEQKMQMWSSPLMNVDVVILIIPKANLIRMIYLHHLQRRKFDSANVSQNQEQPK